MKLFCIQTTREFFKHWLQIAFYLLKPNKCHWVQRINRILNEEQKVLHLFCEFNDCVLVQKFEAGEYYTEGKIRQRLEAVNFEVKGGSMLKEHFNQILKPPPNLVLDVPELKVLIFLMYQFLQFFSLSQLEALDVCRSSHRHQLPLTLMTVGVCERELLTND